MEHTFPNALEQLRATLAADGRDFLLLSALPDSAAHARFIGRFEGYEVVWDMRLYTLAAYAQARGALPTAPDVPLRGLMHIEASGAGVYRLEVALDVPVIDEPVLHKTLIMMRNYRQLQLGLRTWGEDCMR